LLVLRVSRFAFRVSRFAFRASADGDTYHGVMTDNLSALLASGKRLFVTVAGSGPPPEW